MPDPRLLAVSDLHVRHPENRAVVEGLRPGSDRDWLIVAGDVAEQVADVEWALRLLRERFARVIWVPGNHELWTRGKDPVPLRGEPRYRHLVQVCRSIDVVTPEDPYPVWDGPGGPATVAPLFLLYDYTFLPDGAATAEQGWRIARRAGVVCTDEYLLHPDPFPDRAAWCAARVARVGAPAAGVRPAAAHGAGQPLAADPAADPGAAAPGVRAVVRHRAATADWHVRYRATAVVYGHLHIPRVTWEDGVRFVEASLGYPREWRARERRDGVLVADLLPRSRAPAPLRVESARATRSSTRARIPQSELRSGRPQLRRVHRPGPPRSSVAVRGAMSTRQNPAAGAPRVATTAALDTAADVTATVCPSVGAAASQPPTRASSSTNRSPPCGAASGSASQARTASGSAAATASRPWPRHRPRSQSRSAGSTCALSPSAVAVSRQAAAGDRRARSTRAGSPPRASFAHRRPRSSSGSSVGNAVPAVAAVGAWHTRISRALTAAG